MLYAPFNINVIRLKARILQQDESSLSFVLDINPHRVEFLQSFRVASEGRVNFSPV